MGLITEHQDNGYHRYRYRCIPPVQDVRLYQGDQSPAVVQGYPFDCRIFILSEVFDLSALLNWLLTRLITVGLIAVVILFQPEIRRALEQLGRRGVFRNQFKDVNKESAYATVHMLIDAVDDFSSTKTGALIAIEGDTMLTDIIETGVVIDSEISVRLLGNLFYEGSPLHDGAVIIRGDRIYAASCVLPLTNRTSIGKNLGTRHRAGVGLSEICDALVIIVSEETGAISVAKDGVLRRFLDLKSLEKLLLDIYIPSGDSNDILSRLLKGGKRDE